MVKTFSALAAAGLIAAATISVPNKAEANPAWVVPLAIGAGILGVGIVASSANADSYAYQPAYQPTGTVYVQPRARAVANCHIVRERTAGGAWRRVQICE